MTHKILVIDDHPETLDIITRVLRQRGYALVSTTSGRQGLSLAQSEAPDLILLDGMMPEMDGWEVCRRLRAIPETAAIPVIMFSAVNKAEQKLAGFDAGADDYLTKPTEPSELVERVKAMLEGVPPRPELAAEAGVEPVVYAPETANATMTLAGSSNLVAVLGVRGGVGTTILALNLAVCLAALGQETILVDLDLAQGHVALYLKEKVTGGLNQLLALPADQLIRAVNDQLLPSTHQENLRLLLAENNLVQAETPTPAQIKNLLEALLRPKRTVIVDCGRGLTAVNRPIIEQADQLLVCLQPERVGMAVAKQFLPQLEAQLFPHTDLHPVLLDFSGQLSVPRQAVESYLGCSLSAIIPFKPPELNRSVNKSMPLVTLEPEANASLAMARLAQQLMKA